MDRPNSYKESIIKWKKEHPAGTKKECTEDLGISRTTVNKWWDSDTNIQLDQMQYKDDQINKSILEYLFNEDDYLTMQKDDQNTDIDEDEQEYFNIDNDELFNDDIDMSDIGFELEDSKDYDQNKLISEANSLAIEIFQKELRVICCDMINTEFLNDAELYFMCKMTIKNFLLSPKESKYSDEFTNLIAKIILTFKNYTIADNNETLTDPADRIIYNDLKEIMTDTNVEFYRNIESGDDISRLSTILTELYIDKKYISQKKIELKSKGLDINKLARKFDLADMLENSVHKDHLIVLDLDLGRAYNIATEKELQKILKFINEYQNKGNNEDK